MRTCCACHVSGIIKGNELLGQTSRTSMSVSSMGSSRDKSKDRVDECLNGWVDGWIIGWENDACVNKAR
eukprot:347226-Chlamydomonas_euryale.AAC.1